MATIIECAVCFETKGVTVCCAKCDGKSCVGCFQTYLLNSTLTPSCMHCKATLSDDFVLNNTTVAWRVKKYKGYRENLLYDMERARLPNTQVYAEIYQKAVSLTANAKAALATIKEEFDSADKPPVSDVMATHMHNWAYEGRIHEHKETIAFSKRPITTYGLVTWGGMGQVREEKRLVVKACITNGCSGFLDDKFCCGLCDVKVCRECHESLAPNRANDGPEGATEEHECNADTVATIKAIKAEARGCPKCATLISKIDGCDQMWCTQCHATFSWRTGQVEAGHTHNPHYYEFMRRNGGLPRAPGDVGACVGFPTARDLNAAIVSKDLRGGLLLYGDENVRKSGSDNDKLVLTVLELHRHMIHVEETIRRPLNVTQPDNHDLRVQLLTKELTADKMKVTLQQRDKAYRKNLAKSQIYQMAYTVGGDLFRSLIQDKNVGDAKKALDALFVYSNGCLDKVAEAYSCKVKHY
jgi:hypothetical protein